MNGILALLPELYLAGAAMLLLIYGVYRGQRASTMLVVAGILVLGATLWLVTRHYHLAGTAMNGLFVLDPFSSFVKCLLLCAGAMTLLLSSGWLKEDGGRPYEFVVLVLLAILGMMLMVSANDFLALYMGLEMSSLALYVLAAFERDHVKSSEAGLKYFVLGSLASGMMLLGISLVYGFAGSTGFNTLSVLLAMSPGVSPGVVVGLVLIIVGFCFKISAVPFHMWAPDVYEGAPTPVTAFFATAPKLAALALFTRVLLSPFDALILEWQQVVVLVSALSMVAGALAAIRQTNIKRLLAYSSISHAGFMLMGVAAGSSQGTQALLIYAALYIFMSAGAFGCVLMMRRGGVAAEEIRDLSGLSQTQPVMALALATFMFSMAGIPPLAGFFGKLYVILAAVDSGLIGLAVIGLLASVIGCYYYIKVVKVMYFDEPVFGFDARPPFMLRAGIAIGAFVTLCFFLIPTPLVAAASVAAKAMLK